MGTSVIQIQHLSKDSKNSYQFKLIPTPTYQDVTRIYLEKGQFKLKEKAEAIFICKIK